MAACGGTILIADGDAHSCAAAVSLVEHAGYRAVRAGGGEDALWLARTQAPDVVLLAVELPGISGYEVCRRLREEHGSVGIVLVSSTRTDPLDRVAGLLIGADDYLARPFAPDELLARIRALLRRRTREPEGKPAGVKSTLTAREREVLALLADGVSQPGIAEKLVISPKTVAAHIEHILRKLGVHSRAQAVALAYRDGHLGV